MYLSHYLFEIFLVDKELRVRRDFLKDNWFTKREFGYTIHIQTFGFDTYLIGKTKTNFTRQKFKEQNFSKEPVRTGKTVSLATEATSRQEEPSIMANDSPNPKEQGK